MHRQATEEELRLILENVTDIVVIVDQDGIFRVLSPFIHSRLGYDPAEVIGKSGFDYIHPEDRDRVIQTFWRMLRAETEAGRETFRLRRADGRYLWFEAVGRAVWRGGTIEGIVVTGRDVTDRMRMEEELRERERKYRAIVESTNDAIYALDFEGNILDVNENACRMLGYGREELAGANLGMIDPTWSLPNSAQLESLLRNEMLTLERENRRKDGSTVPVEVSVRIVDWAGSGLVMGFVRDITERKAAEAALRRSEHQYRLLVDNTMDFVTRFSVDGTILFVSGAIEAVLGYRPGDLTGRSCLDFVHPEDRAAAEEAFGRVREGGAPEMLECRLLTPDDRERWFEVRANTFWNDASSRVELISVTREITERRAIQESLRQFEKAYRDIFDNALVGIYRSLPGGRFIMMNEAGAKILGYDSTEEMLRSVTDLEKQVYVDVNDRLRTFTQLEDRDTTVVELPIRRRNGEIAWLANHVRIIRDGNGDVRYYEGVAIDITERKKAEANLQQTLDNLEQLVRERTVELNEANIALRVLLDRRTEDQRVLEEKLQLNVNELLLPALDELRRCGLSSRGRHYVDLLEANLKDVTSPFVSTLSSCYRYLTPKEIEVANMIREGKKTKEIAEILGISAITVDSHRIRIRRKLGLTGDKANLRSRLLSIR